MSLIPSSKEESETERNGFLSTRREIHAFVVGAAVGFITGLSGSYELGALFMFSVFGAKLDNKHLDDIQQEAWYALGSFLLTLCIGMGLVVHFGL
jgi:hypothetical protein